MANYVSLTSDKSKKKAFWLCLLLGWLGIHRFYVGKIGTGIIYMFTAGFFIIGWWRDLVLIAMGKFKDNVGQYLRQ